MQLASLTKYHPFNKILFQTNIKTHTLGFLYRYKVEIDIESSFKKI